MTEWKDYKWGDIASLEYGRALSNYLHNDGKYPVYGTNGKIGTTNEILCPFPSLIIGRKGAYRGVHYSRTPFYVIDTAFYLKPKIADLDMTFAYYQLLTVDINGMDSGSAIPSTSRDDFYDLDISLPSLPEQRAIAEILSSLDDKIDLLHRQIKTLEAMAETLFRHWFVEGVESSWGMKSLDEIANYLNGLALQKYPSNGGESLPVIKIRELNQGITETTDRCSRDIPEQYIIQDGDILFSWSGSLQVVIWHDGEGALNQHLFKITSEHYPKWFIYLATKHHLAEFRAIAESKSTTMGHIQRHHLREALISIPQEELFNQYDKSISPLIEKLIKNNAQIKTLKKQRNILLPKLMSGDEVRIKF